MITMTFKASASNAHNQGMIMMLMIMTRMIMTRMIMLMIMAMIMMMQVTCEQCPLSQRTRPL